MTLPQQEGRTSAKPCERPCNTCALTKPISEFRQNTVAGRTYWSHKCKECTKPEACARKKKWYANDPERAKADSRSWYSKNKQVANEAVTAYRAKDPVKWREYHKQWRDANRHKLLNWARKYQAAKLMATPLWADPVAMLRVYELAQALRESGTPCEVDHIVPLRSKLVCGLHVEHNLAIVPPEVNNAKGNRWWPDMPEKAT